MEQNWFESNVANPALNTLIIEPHNAITSSVNDLSKRFGGAEVFSDWDIRASNNARLFSPEWATQSVTGGVCSVVPYTIAAVGSRVVLGLLSKRIPLLAPIARSGSANLILGGAVYDAMRKPHEGESRLSNGLAGAAQFGIFELGRGKSQIFLGALGGGAQQTIKSVIAKGELPDVDSVSHAMLSGAATNMLLPSIQNRIFGKPDAHAKILGPAQHDVIEMPSLVRSKKNQPFSSNLELFMQDSLKMKDVEARIYKPPGMVSQVVMPEKYAALADKVREHKAVGFAKGRPLLPEELVLMLKETPQPDLISKTIISPRRNPFDKYYASANGGHDFLSFAEAQPRDGIVSFFRPRVAGGKDGLAFLRSQTMHEWWHLLEAARPGERELFAHALAAEPGRSSLPGYLSSNGGEHWAGLGTRLLSPDGNTFRQAAAEHPVKSVVLGQALEGALLHADEGTRSTHHQRYIDRAKFLKESIMPKAQESLAQQVLNGQDGAGSQAALRLLCELDGGKGLLKLQGVETLNLSSIILTPSQLQNLAQVRSLKHLNLSGTFIYGDLLKILKPLDLKSLDVRGTELAGKPQVVRSLFPHLIKLEH